MMFTKRKLTTLSLATVGVIGALAASFFAPMRAANENLLEPILPPLLAAKKTLAKKITHRGDDIGDVASLLNIQKYVCEVELKAKFPSTRISVDIEIYKDGQKQKTRLSGPAFKVDKRDTDPIDRIEVALLAADLDYLPLGGAIKNHHRVQLKLDLKRGSLARSTDVPKELFDFNRVSASGWFSHEAGSATEAPLFYIHARSDTHAMSDTVPELIQRNPKGDLLIAYLRVRKE